MGLIQKISKIALTPSVAIGNLITKGISKVTKKEYGTTTAEELSNTTAGKILGTAIAGTTIALIPAIAGRSATISGIKSVVPTTTKGKVIAGVSALAIGGAISKEPEATTKAIINTPSNIANVGGNIATLLANPSIESAKELITENPVIVGAGATALISGGALAIGSAVSNYNQTQAIKDQTQAIISATNTIPAGNIMQTSPPASAPAGLTTGSMTQSVMPAQTTTKDITATTGTGKRKKSRSKTQGQQIKQSVRVNVVNSSSANRTMKKYLNTIQLTN